MLCRCGWTRDTERVELVPLEKQLGGLSGAIRLEPGRALRVEKVPVADCRLGKAFGLLPESCTSWIASEWALF